MTRRRSSRRRRSRSRTRRSRRRRRKRRHMSKSSSCMSMGTRVTCYCTHGTSAKLVSASRIVPVITATALIFI